MLQFVAMEPFVLYLDCHGTLDAIDALYPAPLALQGLGQTSGVASGRLSIAWLPTKPKITSRWRM